MKKKTFKKLTLTKINIASLNVNDRLKIKGGLIRPTTDTDITDDGDNDTNQTFCFMCGLTRTAR